MGCLIEDMQVVSLEQAISCLEAGEPCDGIRVDLGGGRFAEADGPLGRKGLLQRLRGHRLLMAMVQDVAGLQVNAEEVSIVSEEVQELLDAVKMAR